MKYWTLMIGVLLAGCTTTPPTNVHQPMTARPTARYDAPMGNGAIFQTGQSRPLFEDRRARFVGEQHRAVEATRHEHDGRRSGGHRRRGYNHRRT